MPDVIIFLFAAFLFQYFESIIPLLSGLQGFCSEMTYSSMGVDSLVPEKLPFYSIFTIFSLLLLLTIYNFSQCGFEFLIGDLDLDVHFCFQSLFFE